MVIDSIDISRCISAQSPKLQFNYTLVRRSRICEDLRNAKASRAQQPFPIGLTALSSAHYAHHNEIEGSRKWISTCCRDDAFSNKELGIPTLHRGLELAENFNSFLVSPVMEYRVEKVRPCVYNALVTALVALSVRVGLQTFERLGRGEVMRHGFNTAVKLPTSFFDDNWQVLDY